MEPVRSANSAGSVSHHEDRSCLEQGKWCLRILPIPILGVMVGGGVAAAAWTAFGSGTLKAAAIANVAYDLFAAGGSFVSCGCYYWNMPNKSFEEDVERQLKANNQLKTEEQGIDSSIQNFHAENEALKNKLEETDKKTLSLATELDKKSDELLNLSKTLKATLAQLGNLKDDYANAQAAITEAKKLIANMMAMSKLMKSNIKASSAAAHLLKDCNQNFDKEIKGFNADNKELSDLIKDYSKIVTEEHAQFSILMDAVETLNKTCFMLKEEMSQLSADDKKLGENIDRDIKNTNRLETIEKQLELLNKQLI